MNNLTRSFCSLRDSEGGGGGGIWRGDAGCRAAGCRAAGCRAAPSEALFDDRADGAQCEGEREGRDGTALAMAGVSDRRSGSGAREEPAVLETLPGTPKVPAICLAVMRCRVHCAYAD